jgi:hypothetical protein
MEGVPVTVSLPNVDLVPRLQVAKTDLDRSAVTLSAADPPRRRMRERTLAATGSCRPT